MLLDSPRTALDLDKPAGSLAVPGCEPGSVDAFRPRFAVFNCKPREVFGGGLFSSIELSSTQSAGVGGTGPRDDA